MTDNNNSGHGFANGLTYFLIGGGIGAIVALLFAPKSGNALRSEIADVSRRGYDATLEKANDLKEHSAEIIQTVKDKTVAAYDFASAKLSSGSESVTDAVAGGIEHLQNEADITSKQGNGRKASNIV